MQQDDDLLLVPLQVVRGPHDQRSGEQVLLLERMGVHSVRAAGTDRKGVPASLGWLQEDRGIVEHAVRLRRRQPVPVDQRRLVDDAGQRDVEFGSGVQRQSGTAVGPDEGEVGKSAG